MTTPKRDRAVVADDDGDSRELVGKALRTLGFEVSEAVGGLELTDHVAGLYAKGGVLALVVSDIGMPGCDGIEATRRLRSISATLPIVLITGFTDAATWRAGFSAGANEILSKPLVMSELRSAVARLRDVP